MMGNPTARVPRKLETFRVPRQKYVSMHSIDSRSAKWAELITAMEKLSRSGTITGEICWEEIGVFGDCMGCVKLLKMHMHNEITKRWAEHIECYNNLPPLFKFTADRMREISDFLSHPTRPVCMRTECSRTSAVEPNKFVGRLYLNFKDGFMTIKFFTREESLGHKTTDGIDPSHGLKHKA